MFEIKSVLAFLSDEIQRNNERIENLKKYLENEPAESIVQLKRGSKVYYYKKFWQNGKSQFKYFGNSQHIDLESIKKSLQEKNSKKQDARSRYKLLLNNNRKLIKIRDYARKFDEAN